MVLPTYLYLRVDPADLDTAIQLGARPADDEVPESLRQRRGAVVRVRSDSNGPESLAGSRSHSAILAALRNAGISWEQVGAGVSTARAA